MYLAGEWDGLAATLGKQGSGVVLLCDILHRSITTRPA
jgi:hypothetical protein